MAKAPNIRKQITEAKLALKSVMQENLAKIAQSLVDKVMSRVKELPDSRRMNAITDVKAAGQVDYQAALLSAMAVVAGDALTAVRKEIPGGKKVQLAGDEDSLKLGDFDQLPLRLKNKVKKQAELVFADQIAGVEKAVFFQFSHSVDSTDSLATLQDDLEQAAEDYLTGPSIDAGAGVTAAQMINETRSEFFDSDDDALDGVEAYEFVNGDPVSPICVDLAGTVFAKDDPDRFRYTPPLHFNCKSYIVPILKGNPKADKIQKLKPSSKKAEDAIQFSEGHECGSCGAFHGE